MGGGDGVIISRDSAVETLKNPIVWASLPVTMRGSLEPILKKDSSTWTDEEVETVIRASGRSMRR